MTATGRFLFERPLTGCSRRTSMHALRVVITAMVLLANP
jgi:hypothetical protein